MAFWDFLTGASQNKTQGLPPEHSALARVLEMVGGMTGISPLAAIGYMADQPSMERFNEAYWPKFKETMKTAGVPEQQIDMLDSMPMSARVQSANALYQNALAQQKQGTPQLFSKPGGGLDWIRPGQAVPPGELPYEKGKPQFDYWYEVGDQDQVVNEQVLPKGSPRSGPRWFTAGGLKAPAAETETARLQAKDRFKNQQPFNVVDKENIPFVTQPNGQESPVPTTTPYGQVVNLPGVFYVPKTLVTNGTYVRLNALPSIGQQLVDASPKILGQGGLMGLARRELMGIKGSPAYSSYKTAGATYVDTVASALSRRVNQSMIDNWSAAIYGPFATPASVKTAVDEINQAALDMKQSIKAVGLSNTGAEIPSTLGATWITNNTPSGGPKIGGRAVPRPSFPYVRTLQSGDDLFVQDSKGKFHKFDTSKWQWP